MSDHGDQDEQNQGDDELPVAVTITIEPPEATLGEVTGLDEEQTLNVIAAALDHLEVDQPIEIGVLITTDDALRVLNRDFRGLDEATDVLSFPSLDEPLIDAPADQLWQVEEDSGELDDPELEAAMEPGLNGAAPDLADDDAVDEDDDALFDDLDESEYLYLGDIALSHEAVKRQATQAGHSVAWECAYLLAHGVLHLAGYDDQTDAGYKAMVAHQEAILAELDIHK